MRDIRLPEWTYAHTVLTFSTLAFFGTMLGRLSISPVIPLITDGFAITNTTVGLALTGMWMAYAISHFPSGIAGDRYGERSIIIVALLGTALMGMVVAVAPSVGVFIAGVVLLGAFAGLHYSTATNLLARTHDNLGFAIGIHTIGAPAGGLIAPIAAAWVGYRYGWRPAVALGALVAVPIALVFALRITPMRPRFPDTPMRERIHPSDVTGFLMRPRILFTALFAFSGAFVWQGVASFLPTFLIDYHDLSVTFAGVLFSLYFLIQALSKPLLGRISDIFPRDAGIGVSLITGATGMAGFILSDGLVGVLFSVILIGTGLGMAVTVEPRFMDIMSDEEQGMGFGLIRMVFLMLSALGSVSMGFLADTFGWAVAFLGMSGGLLMLLLILAVNTIFRWGL